MENQKRLDKVDYSKHHLPEDVWPNILSRLPSKSLVRFRSVSKSFQSLIMDPDFHRLHLKSFKNNVDETGLLVVKLDSNAEVRCIKTWETESDAHFNLGRKWIFDCSIDGLVLLKTFEKCSGFRDLRVWNLSIRKFHDFPPVPQRIQRSKGVKNLFIDVEIGLGYDELSKDYKHVKLIIFKDVNHVLVLHSVAVYSLGAGSWKIIPFQGSGFSNWHWTCRDYSLGSVCLRGCLYFIALNQDTNMPELVWIDLSREVCCSTNLPDDASTVTMPSLFCYRLQLTLVDGRCSLAFYDFWCVQKSVWVLQSESMATWTKRYSFDLMSDRGLLYVTKNGNVLLVSLENHDAKKKLIPMIWSYDLETKEEKIVLEKECSNCDICEVCVGHCDISEVCGYIESLVLLK